MDTSTGRLLLHSADCWKVATRDSSGDEIPERDRVPKCGVGPYVHDGARFYLLLLALFILTSILNANFLAQTI